MQLIRLTSPYSTRGPLGNHGFALADSIELAGFKCQLEAKYSLMEEPNRRSSHMNVGWQ
jgi:hypothetical protein